LHQLLIFLDTHRPLRLLNDALSEAD
jgi:hypothetical protein